MWNRRKGNSFKLVEESDRFYASPIYHRLRLWPTVIFGLPKVILQQDIQIEGGVRFERITKLRIEENLNEHATAYLTGILHEQISLEEVYRLNMETNIRIKIAGELRDTILFAGVPVDLEMKQLSGVKYLSLTLKSHSIKLDIKRISRSFQDINNPYRAIFKQIVESEYQGSMVDAVAKDKLQGQFILQYQETDWQLLKRLASQLDAVIIAHMEANRPQIGIGTLMGQEYTENIPQFEIQKNIGSYMKNTINFPNWNELDFVSIVLESTQLYTLCDIVIHNEIKYLVAERISEMQYGGLIHAYRLQPIGSFRQNILYNHEIIGLSLEGRVIAVNGECVQVHLLVDTDQSETTAYWHNFNTPYTAEGHMGMYIMPEVGSMVQLYFPNKDESLAYIRMAIRKDNEQNSKTKDPHTKYFETIHGKEFAISPNNMNLTAVHGSIHINMSDGGGISFTSSEDLSIQGRNINIHGDSVSIHGGDSLNICTGSASALFKGIVDIKGMGDVTMP